MYKPRRDSYSEKSRGGNRFGGNSYPRRENRDRGGFGGGRDREERPSFEAICAECGKPCRVPFRPNGTKPVLCKMCFEQEGGQKPSFRDRPSFGRDRDRDIRPDRPITRTLGDRDVKPSRLEEQLTRVEAKLDALIKSFNEALEDSEEDEVAEPQENTKDDNAKQIPEKKKTSKKTSTTEEKPKKTKKK